MLPFRLEYVGYRCGDRTRDYRLRVRHPGGQDYEFTVAIEQEAFLSHRVRYQDAAEICFLKLQRAVAAWDAAPESGPPAPRQTVTEEDLLEYRAAHSSKPRLLAVPPRPE
jgi:hypothetical protein